MDTSMFIGVVLGICITFFILLLVRDILFKHYMKLILADIQVQPIMNIDRLLNSVSSFLVVLESTSDLFSDMLSEDTLKDDEEKRVILRTRDSINAQINTLRTLVSELEGIPKNER